MSGIIDDLLIKRIRNKKDDSVETNGFHSKVTDYKTLSAEGTFSLDEAIDKIGFGKFQYKLTFFVGLCWMADAMEIMILSILSPTLHCQWRISTVQEALLTTLVFFGMMVGSAAWGAMSDIYGRKSSILMCAVYTVFYGILSAFSPNYIWLLILRTLVGIGIGGVPQAVTIYSEFLPTKLRFAIVFVQVFWSCGTFLIVLAAVFIMPQYGDYGWRYLVLVAALPCSIFTIACIWMPESMRYDVSCGNVDRALATLTRIANDNGKTLPEGQIICNLDETNKNTKRGRILDLFKPEFRVTSSLLWFIWIATCFSYYGLVLMSTELYQHSDYCSGSGSRDSQLHEMDCALDCEELSQDDYINLLWTSFAEFPGIIMCVILIELIGRKKALALQLCIFTVFTALLSICFSSEVLTGLIFIARSSITGAFQTLYVYTPEVYATEVRAIGLGSSCAAARVGAILTPFVGQVMLEHSITLAVCIYAFIGVAGAICSLALPIETKGRNLGTT